MKEYDGDAEALEWEENHRFLVPKGAHWEDVRNVSENVGVAIVEAFRKIGRLIRISCRGFSEMAHGPIKKGFRIVF